MSLPSGKATGCFSFFCTEELDRGKTLESSLDWPSEVSDSQARANKSNSYLSVVVGIAGFCSHTPALGEMKLSTFIGPSLLLWATVCDLNSRQALRRSFRFLSVFAFWHCSCFVMLCYVDGSHKEYKAFYTSWANPEQISDFVHNVPFIYGEQGPWWPQTHCHPPMLELQVSTTIPRDSVFSSGFLRLWW